MGYTSRKTVYRPAKIKQNFEGQSFPIIFTDCERLDKIFVIAGKLCVKEILKCWKYRRLTLIGKITVIKSLVVSQLVYLLSPLCSNYKVLTEMIWFYQLS